MIIEIKICADNDGSDYGGKFVAMDTIAHADYDGFGTFTVHEYNDGERTIRTVLIREEHQQWQLARYSSGLKTATPTVHDESAIREALWNRLVAKEHLNGATERFAGALNL
jgi:hypothetical protein